jgi:hypothetical protein
VHAENAPPEAVKEGKSMMYQVPPGVTPVVMVREQKSVAAAIILAFFFGPLGMFYSTITGALVLLGVNLVLFFLGLITFGLGWFLFFFTWIGGIIWAGVEANTSNQRAVMPVTPVAAVMPGVIMPAPMPIVYQIPSVPYPQPGYPPPGALPPPYQGRSGPYQQPGSMPNPYPGQSAPYQQPGSAPNPYAQPPHYPG